MIRLKPSLDDLNLIRGARDHEIVEAGTYYGISGIVVATLVPLTYYLSEIRHLTVHSEHRRQGHGRRLVAFLLDKAETAIVVCTIRLDNTPSLSLFSSIGFRKVAEYDNGCGPVGLHIHTAD